MATLAEEDYIKAFYTLGGVEGNPISTSAVSEFLQVNPASVSGMIKKLSAKRLLNYRRSHGASLTPKGKKLAVSIVRKHRLWETFLFEKLGYSWEEVHEIAEQLEHIRSEDLINRLESFLGFPKKDPHGDPIPDKDGKIEKSGHIPLTKLEKGEKGIVAGVGNQDTSFLKQLNQMKVKIGSTVKVVEINGFDRSLETTIDGKKAFLSEKLGNQVLIFKK